jgi:hypothetical protein
MRVGTRREERSLVRTAELKLIPESTGREYETGVREGTSDNIVLNIKIFR